MRYVVTLGVLAWAIGCGGSKPKAAIVPLNQVPEPLFKVAKEKLPEISFDFVRKMPNGNYVLRGKARNGRVREIELTSSGEVVEIE